MRNISFDIMKGIGIVAVIIGHSSIPVSLRNFIFTWHMPMFFMISGYFYRPNSVVVSLKKNFKSLIIPYLFTAVFLSLLTFVAPLIGNKEPYSLNLFINQVYAIIYGAGSAMLPNGGNYFVGAIWFLLALFWCRFAFNIIYTRVNDYYIIITLLVSILSTFTAQYVFIPSNVLQGFSAMLFFLLGYIAKERKILFKNVNIFIVYSIILVLILYSSFQGPIGMVTCYYPCFIINIVASVGAGYLIYKISSSISDTKWGGVFIIYRKVKFSYFMHPYNRYSVYF